MSLARKLLWGIVAAIGAPLALLLIGFGFIQTAPGQLWLTSLVSGQTVIPGFVLTLEGVSGFIPFHLHVRRITVADTKGVFATLDDFDFDIAASELLSRRAHIGRLNAAELRVARLPAGDSSASLLDTLRQLRVPHLPVTLQLDRLAIERLVLEPPVFGEPITASLNAKAVVAGDSAEVDLGLQRVDGNPGSLGFALAMSGSPPVLDLKVTASEPQGTVLAKALGRGETVPLSLTFGGKGPLSSWRGKIEAQAGTLARFATDISITGDRDAVLTLAGSAAFAPLLASDVAPLVGDSVPIAARVTFSETGAMSIDSFTVEFAAGNLSGDGRLGAADGLVLAHLTAALPHLAALTPLLGGEALAGSATIAATVTGTAVQPQLELVATGEDLQQGGSGAARAEARLRVGTRGAVTDPAAPIEIASSGRLEGLVLPAGAALPAGVSRDLQWSFAGSALRDGSAVELSEFSAQGAGVDITGVGRLSQAGQVLEGQLTAAVADLRPFTAMFGHPVQGGLRLQAKAAPQQLGTLHAELTASLARLHLGIPAADALLGHDVSLAGLLRRDASGAFVLDHVTASGANLQLSGSGRYDLASGQVAATIDARVAQLQALAAAVGTELAGRLDLRATVAGIAAQPQLHADVTADELRLASARFDKIHLTAKLRDLARLAVELNGDFRGGGVDGTLALDAEKNGAELVLSKMRLAAAESGLDGSLRIDLGSYLASGTITGNFPDLARWSRLAGMALSGGLRFRAGLSGRNGQSLDLTANGERLALGSGSSRLALDRVAVSADLANVLHAPSGRGQADVSGVHFASGELTTVTVKLDSAGPGRLAFTGATRGRVSQPLTLTLAGDVGFAGNAAQLRVSRLDGTIGPDRIRLDRVLTATKRGADMTLADLALTYGTGQLSGGGAMRGQALTLQLAGRNLSVASAAKLAGYQNVGGTIGFDINLAGAAAAPQGRFSLTGRNLSMALAKQHLPTLSVDVSGQLGGRSVDLTGRVGGLRGETIAIEGTVPVLVSAAPFQVALLRDGRLALRVRGAGEIANLADLLPLGEDRVQGRYTLDAGIGGTPALPSAEGRVTIANGRYENFLTGAVLTNLRLDLAGNRDRFTVTQLSASDTASGTINARGDVVLTGAAGPTANLAVAVSNFRIAARDEAVVAATGTLTAAGPLASPNVVARLTVNRADVSIPAGLPPSVTRIKVIEINSRTGQAPPKPGSKPGSKPGPAEKAEPPAVPAALDIQVSSPGRIFVRGHGLDSEWRADVRVTGTTAAPRIGGSLTAIRGTFDLLGKTFQVTEGVIAFQNSGRIDPSIDIVAESSASDITAQVRVGGLVSSPSIALTSTPMLPQDEIVSRVLFNRGVTQITAAEGVQVAMAAATLSGGGPGVLDKLRTGLGLDRLSFGAAANGPASSNLNPAAGGSKSSTGTAISGGKYVAKGVYVGVTQGLTAQSSKVTVEVEVMPHVTVETDVGQNSGNGVGLNYKYDY